MKLYSTNKDDYGCIEGMYDYLVDRGITCSGTKKEMMLEIMAWNFIAKIVNKIKGVFSL